MVSGAAFRVLACFADTNTGNFADLCARAGYPTDLGGYYIRQLVKGGYLEKQDRGQYAILPKGKQELAFNYGRQLLAPRPRLGALVIARQGDSFVVLKRAKQPYTGIVEWPASVANLGEPLLAVAKRIMTERLGITPESPLSCVGFFRRIDRYEDTVFDDKLFAVYTTRIPTDATLKDYSSTGELSLCKKTDLENLPNRSKALLDFLHFSERGGSEERTYTMTREDFSNE